MTERDTFAAARANFVQQLPLLIALVVLWMLLWGAVSWLNLITGFLLALLVTRVFYLPPVELSGRFNPIWFAAFLVRFVGELVFASFQVAFQAFDPRGVRSNAVIAVQLHTRSDFIMTLTAIALSLIPGSLVVEADRERSILYLHALNVGDSAGVDQVRSKVLAVENRLVRALGSSDDVRRTRP
ncbi:MAG: Na+/H+ antiporter subunit [Microbacteriaceae bacterium]|jgi:multicomponent Na+:H+ antiporter subunit E|nr:Na+/H+ antiporter subunit [Microbacteriaceae bacterium]HEV7956808.1 Na+/H+ antiporter subunit E [Marisediminicola sp.]